MLVEITKAEVKEKSIVITAENLEKVLCLENLYEDMETETVTFVFAEMFEISVLEQATRKIWQCGYNQNPRPSFGKRLEKLVGARTVLLPEKYIQKETKKGKASK